MRVANIRTESRPEGRVRLVADLTYASPRRGRARETAYFDVDARHADDLSRSGNPWLVLALAASSCWGEPLEIEGAVDPMLLEGAREVMRTWRRWYDSPREVAVEAETAASEPPEGDRVGAFFSGGVDSFFTALDHGDGSGLEERGPIDELIILLGFDVGLHKRPLLERARRSARRVADALGKGCIDLETNLQDLAIRDVPWGPLGHGPALAACALALERRFRRVLIPGTAWLETLAPWGSHPEIEPQLSTAALDLVQDGLQYDKPVKMEKIAAHPVVQRNLRVCQHRPEGLNCGTCEKCVYTMLVMDALVGLEHFDAFEAERLDLDLLRRQRIHHTWHVRGYDLARTQAVLRGREDLVAAIDQALARSARWAGWARFFDRARERGWPWPLVRWMRNPARSGLVPPPPGFPGGLSRGPDRPG